MENTQKPPRSETGRPGNDRLLSGSHRANQVLVRAFPVFILFGVASLTLGCAGGQAAPQDRAQDSRLRSEASRVFANQQGFDSEDPSRIFGDGGEAPMTRTLSIDGSAPDPRLSQGRDPITATTARRNRDQTSEPDTTALIGGWSILLERFTGPAHETRAQERAAVLARSLGRSDVRVRNVSSGSAVVVGGYEGPNDQRAQRDLQYVKSLVSQGERPYALAILVPPPVVDTGTNPRHSLLVMAKGLEPIYTHTLQVAVFAGDENTRRAQAERHCARLRNEGHEAFYYHGPRASSVTIGTFTARDFNMNTGEVSARLERLREQFPHNLYNGGVQRDEQTGEAWNSALVEIPRS